jgi:hypothetical protein
MTSKKYDIWRQSLTVATVVTFEQLSRVEKYGLKDGEGWAGAGVWGKSESNNYIPFGDVVNNSISYQLLKNDET